MSFNITKNMLLESTHSLIGHDVSRSVVPTDSYFNIALSKSLAVSEAYSNSKFGLYSDIVLENATDDFKKLFIDAYHNHFPEESKLPIQEETYMNPAIDKFIKYFGNSIATLNHAVDSMKATSKKAVEQAKTLTRVAPVKESIEDQDICPICGINPCRCGEGEECDNHEHIYQYTHDKTEIPTLKTLGINIAGEINHATCGGEECKEKCIENKYNELVAGLNDFYDRFRGSLCKESCTSRDRFGAMLFESKREATSVAVNKEYLKYCLETINNYQNAVKAVSENVESIAIGYDNAITALENAKRCVEEMQFVSEDGAVSDMTDDQVEKVDIYCKAEVDKLVNMCNSHLIAVGAQLDSLRAEYDQCKAVISKYLNDGPDVPEAVPTPADSIPDIDGEVAPAATPIQEEPTNEAYDAFLIDLVANESYVDELLANGTYLAEGNIVPLNEGVFDGVAAFFNKIMDFLRGIFQKFTNAINDMLDKNLKYLKDNEGIILKEPVVQTTLNDWYDYNTKAISENTLNQIKFSNLMSNPDGTIGGVDDNMRECAENADATANKAFAFAMKGKGETYTDKFKEYFKGPVVPKKDTSSINNNTLKEMYEYCLNYRTNVATAIDNEKKDINRIYKEATANLNKIKTVDDQAKPAAAQDASKPEEGKTTETPKQGEGNEAKSADSTKESFDYSEYFKDYFSEVSAEPVKSADGSALDANGNKASTNKDKDVVAKYYKNIMSVSNAYIGSKLTAAKDCLNDYITILKWHIKNYANSSGDNKSEADKKEETKGQDTDKASNDKLL